MPVRIPAKISNGGFMEHSGNVEKFAATWCLESVFTDVMQKLLQLRDLDYPGAPKVSRGSSVNAPEPT